MNENNANDKSAEASGIKISDAGKKYVAELVGTFVLVLTGCGTAVLASQYVGWAFAFGFSFLAMFYVIGGISGCHINPAVSISMWAVGKISVKDAAFYILAQCGGAIIGAAALYAIAIGTSQYSLATHGLGQNGYDTASLGGFSMTSALITEVLLTFIFVLVFHGATSKKAPKGFAGLAIGLTLASIHLVGIPITGTSVNPARSLGPAIIVGGTALNQLWLFWVAPIMGGLLAAAVWKAIQ